MHLYEIADQYNEAFKTMTDLEIHQDVIDDTMEGLQGELEVKAQNVGAYYLNLLSDADQIKQAISNMQARLKSINNNADYFKEYLRANMERTGISKIECPQFKISLRKPSKVVQISDNLDTRYIVETCNSAPDKRAIKADLKAGIDIQGAKLVDGVAGLTIK